MIGGSCFRQPKQTRKSAGVAAGRTWIPAVLSLAPYTEAPSIVRRYQDISLPDSGIAVGSVLDGASISRDHAETEQRGYLIGKGRSVDEAGGGGISLRSGRCERGAGAAERRSGSGRSMKREENEECVP
ncbi:hypothetical protein [Burkholderia alba]|uniref:hypothetical protein n=1 Tax=Burkholderia alba TaxID=2683677 RepID=UPI002B05566D|nr:hypothetical protein [Burkholderia alba]